MKTFSHKDIYELGFGLTTAFLVLSVIIFSIYLVAPLVGGQLSTTALIYYGSWIVFGLVGRRACGHGRKELKIRADDYVLLCIAVTINFIVWFKYPLGVILSILGIVIIAIGYIAQNKRLK